VAWGWTLAVALAVHQQYQVKTNSSRTHLKIQLRVTWSRPKKEYTTAHEGKQARIDENMYQGVAQAVKSGRHVVYWSLVKPGLQGPTHFERMMKIK
jgi:hypothetical protein